MDSNDFRLGPEVCESYLTCLAHEHIWNTRGQDAKSTVSHLAPSTRLD
jgi:hypothetical protein